MRCEYSRCLIYPAHLGGILGFRRTLGNDQSRDESLICPTATKREEIREEKGQSTGQNIVMCERSLRGSTN